MKLNKKLDLLSLSELFEYNIFRMPDYQRGYTWDDEQLGQLWKDINSLKNSTSHYMGMLCLKCLSKNECLDNRPDIAWRIFSQDDGNIETKDQGRNLENEDETQKWTFFYVVDGQQRLISLIILLNCLLIFCKENKISVLGEKCEPLDKIYEKYIANPEENENDKNFGTLWKLAYEKEDTCYQYLIDYVYLGNENATLSPSLYGKRLKNAKRFFSEKIKNLYESTFPNEESKKRLDTLFDRITSQLKFNVFFFSDEFDANIIFESMNNRGKPLSNLEKLKNRLIYLTTICTGPGWIEEMRRKLRKTINDSWKKIYDNLGKNEDTNLNDDDKFLRVHWILFYRYKRNKKDAYKTDLFENQFSVDKADSLTPNDIDQYVVSLSEISSYWYYSFFPDTICNTDEIQRINRLNRVGIGYFRPLLIATMMDKQTDSEHKVSLYKSIERYLFVCCRMGKEANKGDSETYRYAYYLYHKKMNIEDITQKVNDRLNGNTLNRCLNVFRDNIDDLFQKEDGFYSWKNVKYFLFEYEFYLRQKKGNKDDTNNKEDSLKRSKDDIVTIEHIFPQKPSSDYWDRQFNGIQDKKIFCNSLGNLLILSRRVNSSLQNLSFDDKKKGKNNERGYEEGSYSEKEIAKKYTDRGPKEIIERGIDLLDFMEFRWNFKFTNNSASVEDENNIEDKEKDRNIKLEILHLKEN